MPWGDGGLSSSSSTASKPSSASAPATRGGWGSGGLNGATVGAPKKKGGGGGGFFSGAGHWIADKASIAGHDISAIPTGLVTFGEANLHDLAHGHSFVMDPASVLRGDSQVGKLVHQSVRGTVATVEHPLRDPFQTALTVFPLLHGVGTAAEIGTAASRAVRAGEGLSGVTEALTRRPEFPVRVLRQGKATVGMPPLSKNAAVRIVQRGYDKTLQKAIDKNEAGAAGGRVTGKLASHAEKRIGGQIQEAARPVQNMRKTVADELEHAGRQLRGRLGNHGFKNSKMAQLALNLTSENITAQEAHLYHMGQVAKGVAPKANLKLAKLYRQMHEQGMLTQDEHGDVQVNAEKFPRLAAVDAKLAAAQQKGDEIVKEYGLMTPEGAKARVDLPGTIVRSSLPEADRTRSIYGPEGRGYTTHMQLEKRVGRSPVARVAGDVVGEARSPIPSKAFTGEARAQGKVPLDTTRLAAQHLRSLLRYVNTSEIRKRWAETGSDTRRSPRDVLVKIAGEPSKPLTPEYEAMLGRGKLTAAENEAHQTSLREYLNHLVPGLRDEKVRAWEKTHDIGAPAPSGYKWVSENTLGDLKNSFAESRGRAGRAFDNLNSAITAQTVYYKIGHVGTRALTNAALNLTEGSLKHSPQSYLLWKQLSPIERLKAYAAAGQHGFAAMPHEGVGRIGSFATKGANFWAHRFDAPFRFNSIAYQAAKAGYRTPAEFRDFLDKLENPEKLDPIERVKVENVAKMTNRENIAYDRLSERERRFLARGLWFYPWVKGSSVWTTRAMLEHPFKAAVGGLAAQQGRSRQQAALGALPSYEFGLTPLGHGRVTNLSTFNPAGTMADLLQLPKFGEAASNLNPAMSMLLHLGTRTDQYGQHSNQPLVDALKAALAPTPEFQIAAAAAGKHSKMFPASNPGWEAFWRMLVGPAKPRNVDVGVLNGAAERERLGR